MKKKTHKKGGSMVTTKSLKLPIDVLLLKSESITFTIKSYNNTDFTPNQIFQINETIKKIFK